MKVQPIPHDVSEPAFKRANLYQHRESRKIYIGVRARGCNSLMELESGSIWSELSPFGESGVAAFDNVTDKYTLKGN